jgi:hypothetical protein
MAKSAPVRGLHGVVTRNLPGEGRSSPSNAATSADDLPFPAIVADDQDMREHLDLLRREFEADQGTFLGSLRGEGIEWDKAAFSRFEKAMRWACGHFQEEDRLDRWMADGFHYASWFVRDWTSHPNFPRPEPEHYYNDCIQRIGDLADWFFRGWHVYTEPHHWPDL